MPTNWPGAYQSDNPVTQDPRWQRRIMSIRYPIPIVENMFEVMLECGHDPLLFTDKKPEVGANCFCGDCYEASKEKPS